MDVGGTPPAIRLCCGDGAREQTAGRRVSYAEVTSEMRLLGFRRGARSGIELINSCRRIFRVRDCSCRACEITASDLPVQLVYFLGLSIQLYPWQNNGRRIVDKIWWGINLGGDAGIWTVFPVAGMSQTISLVMLLNLDSRSTNTVSSACCPNDDVDCN